MPLPANQVGSPCEIFSRASGSAMQIARRRVRASPSRAGRGFAVRGFVRAAILREANGGPRAGANGSYRARMPAPPRANSGSLLDALFRIALWIAYRILLVVWFVFRPRRRGVFIAVWHDGRVLAIRNSYRDWLGLPAGGLRRGETPEQAGRRELAEEVGIAAAPGALRFVCEIPTTFEWKRDRCSFFEIHLDAPIEAHVDHREVVWAGFVTPAEALAAHLAPPVRTYLEARAATSG